MSQARPSGGQGAMCAAGDLPLDQRPTRPSVDVEEKNGPGACTLRYLYPAEETDIVTWEMRDTEDGNVRILFEVKRQGAVNPIYRHLSEVFPASMNLRQNLVCKKRRIKEKERCYKLDLEKKTAFVLENYLRKRQDSPPVTTPASAPSLGQ